MVHIDRYEMAGLYVLAGVKAAGNSWQAGSVEHNGGKSLGNMHYFLLAPIVPRSIGSDKLPVILLF